MNFQAGLKIWGQPQYS